MSIIIVSSQFVRKRTVGFTVDRNVSDGGFSMNFICINLVLSRYFEVKKIEGGTFYFNGKFYGEVSAI